MTILFPREEKFATSRENKIFYVYKQNETDRLEFSFKKKRLVDC